MKDQSQAEQSIPNLNSADVLTWLQNHPEFLTRHAADLPLKLPKYTRKANVTPLHAARAQRAEKQTDKTQRQAEQLVKIVAANAQSARQLYAVLPSVVGCNTLACLRKALQTEIRTGLNIHTVKLIQCSDEEGVNNLTQDEILTLAPQAVTLRTLQSSEQRDFYGNKGKEVKSDCLLHLYKGTQLIGLLALGSNDAQRFYPTQGTDLAELLAQITAVVLGRCI